MRVWWWREKEETAPVARDDVARGLKSISFLAEFIFLFIFSWSQIVWNGRSLLRPFSEWWECLVAVFHTRRDLTCGWRFAGWFRCGRLDTLWMGVLWNILGSPSNSNGWKVMRNYSLDWSRKNKNGRNNFFLLVYNNPLPLYYKY